MQSGSEVRLTGIEGTFTFCQLEENFGVLERFNDVVYTVECVDKQWKVVGIPDCSIVQKMRIDDLPDTILNNFSALNNILKNFSTDELLELPSAYPKLTVMVSVCEQLIAARLN